MNQVLRLFIFLSSGILLSVFLRRSSLTEKIARVLNKWVIRIALPALVLQKIHSLPDFSIKNPAIFLPVSQPWVHFFLSILVVTVLARLFKWSRETWGALVLTVGLGNTSFVGLPLLGAILGHESLGTGVMMDQLGTFPILVSLGVPIAQAVSHSNRASNSLFSGILRILSFPPFLSLILAVFLRETSIPKPLGEMIHFLAVTLAPAALISVGLSIRWSALRTKSVRQPLFVGLGLKLLVFPMIYGVVYSSWAGYFPQFPPLVLRAILLESAMASMITAGLVATENGLNPDLAQLMMGIGIPISLVSVPLWSLVL